MLLAGVYPLLDSPCSDPFRMGLNPSASPHCLAEVGCPALHSPPWVDLNVVGSTEMEGAQPLAFQVGKLRPREGQMGGARAGTWAAGRRLLRQVHLARPHLSDL